jgi:hypothetical protein
VLPSHVWHDYCLSLEVGVQVNIVDDMEDSLIDQLVTTILCMLQSPNREVIKAGLGFIKVVVICVQPALLTAQLETLVVSILKHSRSHTSHFKAKVRHIFERLIRKFGYDDVARFVPEEDQKLVVNIKKRKERAKRKKIQAKDAVATPEEGVEGKATHQKSFEEVLASDESDLGSDGEAEDDAAGSEDDSRKEKKKVYVYCFLYFRLLDSRHRSEKTKEKISLTFWMRISFLRSLQEILFDTNKRLRSLAQTSLNSMPKDD